MTLNDYIRSNPGLSDADAAAYLARHNVVWID
jgi:hypothetical protein